jgi:signal peptidase II
VKKLGSPITHIVIIIAGVLIDQATKIWAVARLGGPNGEPRGEIIEVIGSLVRFQLAYNEGAAFSSRPQDLIPGMDPTLFFGLISIVALTGLFFFYRSLHKEDWPSRLGVALIVAGAMGNFSDRIRIQKVVDFIDCDFPDFIMHRWPTWNIADALVLIGVFLVAVGPKIFKTAHFEKNEQAAAKQVDTKTTEVKS